MEGDPIREIEAGAISTAVANLIVSAVYELGDDVVQALGDAQSRETAPLAKHVLSQLLANAVIAKTELVPLCQDTGSQVIVVELGQDVRIVGGGLRDAVERGVAQATADGYLRCSVVGEPLFQRANTGDNTPPFLHMEVVPGDTMRIIVLPKGGGCENMSAMRMLKPADGLAGVKRFVLDTIDQNAANSCPPLIVGVGVGGTFETVGWLAKKSLLRRVGAPHHDQQISVLEEDLRDHINVTHIGPMGWGGDVTALAVHMEIAPTHMASLPVAVNLQCHSARHKERVL